VEHPKLGHNPWTRDRRSNLNPNPLPGIEANQLGENDGPAPALIGAGEHGLGIVDLALSAGYQPAVFAGRRQLSLTAVSRRVGPMTATTGT
jgi:hypothetical protein